MWGYETMRKWRLQVTKISLDVNRAEIMKNMGFYKKSGRSAITPALASGDPYLKALLESSIRKHY